MRNFCSIIAVWIMKVFSNLVFALSSVVKYLVELESNLNDLLNSSIWKSLFLADLIFNNLLIFLFKNKESQRIKYKTIQIA